MFSLDSCRRVPFRIGLPPFVRQSARLCVQGVQCHTPTSLLHYETGRGHLVLHDSPTFAGLRLVKLGDGENFALPIPTITLILV